MSERDTPGYERRELNPRAIRWAAISLVLLLLAVFVGISLFETALGGRHPKTSTLLIEVSPPRLQTDPAADLANLRACAEAKLNSYGWVDRSAGVIRIPIDRAIILTAERGLPSRTAKPEESK